MSDKISVKTLPNIGLYTMVNGKPQFKYRFSKNKYNGQDEVIKYMKSAIAYGAKPEVLHDVFSNEIIPYESLVMTDGYFRWSSELLYYVENYNLILPDEFITRAKEDEVVKISVESLAQ